jgi:integrase
MGELLALRWRDADFAGATIRVRGSYAAGNLTTPKSGKVRAVPMAPDVAWALAQLGRRENWVGDDDLVFASEGGSYLDGSALRRHPVVDPDCFARAQRASAHHPAPQALVRSCAHTSRGARGRDILGHLGISTRVRGVCRCPTGGRQLREALVAGRRGNGRSRS